MPSLESLSSRSKQRVEQDVKIHSGQPWFIVLLVVLARIVVGGVFVVSGVSKAIDVWGVMYKMLEYASLWDIDVTRSLVLTGSFLLAIWEGVLGIMLLLGCYRRSAVWLLLLTMAVMLPLSVYIYIYDPVADCGCFGDFLVISNAATMYKNFLIVGVLIFLAFYNRKVIGLISPYVQWTAAFVSIVYLLTLGLLGYNIQPTIDFRSYPVGTVLAADATADEDEGDDVVFEFIYEKDGEQKTFTEDNLPDSTWTFVDRKIVSGSIDDSSDFIVYDVGDDVTADAIAAKGPQMLVLIPEINNADISFTFYINALNRYLAAHGGSLIGVIGGDDQGLERWRDLSLAEYPLYTAEPTAIKELVRGDVALVYLEDGVIKWKRTAASIDGEEMIDNIEQQPLSTWGYDGASKFKWLTFVTVALLLIIVVFNNGFRVVLMLMRRRRNDRRAARAKKKEKK